MPLIRYALDPTGNNPSNLVDNKPITLTGTGQRAHAMQEGAYFTISLRLTDEVSGMPLMRGIHYRCLELAQESSLKYQDEICYGFLVTDPTVSNSLIASYQLLGGDVDVNVDAVLALQALIANQSGTVDWSQSIVDIPYTFPPTDHIQDAYESYGYQYVVDAIGRITQQLAVTPSQPLGEVYNEFQGLYSLLNTNYQGLASTTAGLQAQYELASMKVGDIQYTANTSGPTNTIPALGQLVPINSYPDLKEVTGKVGDPNGTQVVDAVPVLKQVRTTSITWAATNSNSFKLIFNVDTTPNATIVIPFGAPAGAMNRYGMYGTIPDPLINSSFQNNGSYGRYPLSSTYKQGRLTYYMMPIHAHVDNFRAAVLFEYGNQSNYGVMVDTSGLTLAGNETVIPITAIKPTVIHNVRGYAFTVYGNTDGSITYTQDDGVTWTNLNQDLGAAVRYIVSTSVSTGNTKQFIYANDQGTFYKCNAMDMIAMAGTFSLPTAETVYSCQASADPSTSLLAVGLSGGRIAYTYNMGVTWTYKDYSSQLGSLAIDFLQIDSSDHPKIAVSSTTLSPAKVVIDDLFGFSYAMNPFVVDQHGSMKKLIRSDAYFCSNEGDVLPGIFKAFFCNVTTTPIPGTNAPLAINASCRQGIYLYHVGDGGQLFEQKVTEGFSISLAMSSMAAEVGTDFKAICPANDLTPQSGNSPSTVLAAGSKNRILRIKYGSGSASFSPTVGGSTDINTAIQQVDGITVVTSTGTYPIKRHNGVTWKAIAVPCLTTSTGDYWSVAGTNPVLNCMIKTHQGYLIAVGDYGNIIVSTNRGRNWTKAYTPFGTDITFKTIIEHNQVFYVGGTQDSLYQSTDGLNWTLIDLPTAWSKSYNALAPCGSGLIMAVTISGQNHGIFMTQDYQTLVPIENPDQTSYAAVQGADIKALTVATWNSTTRLYAYSPGCVAELTHPALDLNNLFDPGQSIVAIESSDSTMIALSGAGVILRTTDGANFTKTDLSVTLDSVISTTTYGNQYANYGRIATNNKGTWVITTSYGNAYYYSIDDGLTWTNVVANTNYPQSVAYDALRDKFWVVYVDHTVEMLSDQLTTRTALKSITGMGASEKITVLSVLDGAVYVGSASGYIYSSRDQGDTWSRYLVASGYYPRKAVSMGGIVAFPCREQVVQTSDQGLTWTKQQTNAAALHNLGLYVDESLWISVGVNSLNAVSTDRGVTWSNSANVFPSRTHLQAITKFKGAFYVGHEAFYSIYYGTRSELEPYRSTGLGVISRLTMGNYNTALYDKIPYVDVSQSIGVTAHIVYI